MFSDQLFDSNNQVRAFAAKLYEGVKDFPLVSPHGHVPPQLFADPGFRFGSPAELLIMPDHYVLRLLYSQGISLPSLGISGNADQTAETDHRKIWQTFADNFYLFNGTPSGFWISAELRDVFGVGEKLTGETAQDIYDQIEMQLATPEFSPRALYARFDLEVLCTTDAATDRLEEHQAIRDSSWDGKILPTFRPGGVINLDAPGWRANIDLLSDVSGISIVDYDAFIEALENRRAYFKMMGATATDHSAISSDTSALSLNAAREIFDAALRGDISGAAVHQFSAHMLYEMARMSTEDGLVMQLHPGSYRNHNLELLDAFGPDMGADIPVKIDFTKALKPLLDSFGNHPDLTMILYTLDESTYSRELAPLAGHYPTLKLGAPWWFHDSPNGIARYLDRVVETAGIYNLAGFVDDARSFPSIPARHDVWRRSICNWLGDLVARHLVDFTDAEQMAAALVYGLVKRAYRL